MRHTKLVLSGVAAGLLAGCATAPEGLPPVPVYASGETVPVGTANEDAADDPAIWRNAADPAASLIVATDKKAGLYVYGLDGQIRSFVSAGEVNNVDLVDLDELGAIVVASDRNDPLNAAMQVYRLDPQEAELELLGTVPAGQGEGYGLCLWHAPDGLRAYSVLKNGVIEEYLIAFGPGVEAVPLLTRSVPSQPEGCVVDARDGTLYIGEENGGIWKFEEGGAAGELVAPIDNRYLVADVEGLAIAPSGANGGYVIASSQGDNAYAAFRLPEMRPVGRFRIAEGEFGSAEETDGIDLFLGDFGPDYPGGLFVVQDGQNGAGAQNFKLVSWDQIRSAIGID